jgi:5,6,7,8-tetrahydromethanopterin hydro-lyase
VGTALATAAAAPRQGYVPFTVVMKPNVPVKPITLFAGKADLRGERHEKMNWGPAQIGVAEGVAKALLDGIFPPEAADEWCIIAAVWVAWAADGCGCRLSQQPPGKLSGKL